MAGFFIGIPQVGLEPIFDAAAEARKKLILRAVLVAVLAVAVFLIVRKRKG
jgi:hypothetical protein